MFFLYCDLIGSALLEYVKFALLLLFLRMRRMHVTIRLLFGVT